MSIIAMGESTSMPKGKARKSTTIRRDCQYLHGFSARDIKRFVDLARIKPGMVVLEGMCGSASISQELAKHKKIKLYLLDNSSEQIERAKNSVQAAAEFRVGSILKMPYPDKFFDRVFIRNGHYEIPKQNQIAMYTEIRRTLKKGGLFLNWGIKLNAQNQEFFQQVIRLKDRLAGFSNHVRNRYYMTETEFRQDIKAAGFNSLEFFETLISYDFSTRRWCEIDFCGNRKKQQQLNIFIRESIAKSKPTEIEVKDAKNDIILRVPAMISVAAR